VHVHGIGEGAEAEFWPHPARVAMSDGLDARTLREWLRVVDERGELIEGMWHAFFGSSGSP
jgi:hypothetical protein